MVLNGKPHTDIYLEVLDSLDIKPSEALIFEDSENGILADFSAGCDVIMVTDIEEYYEGIDNKIIHKTKAYDEAIKYLDGL